LLIKTLLNLSIVLAMMWIYTEVAVAQDESFKLSMSIDLDHQLTSTEQVDSGRLMLFVSDNTRGEPAKNLWPRSGNYLFAKNFSLGELKKGIQVDDWSSWVSSTDWNPNNTWGKLYHIQVLWAHNTAESRPYAPGNFTSQLRIVQLQSDTTINMVLQNVIPPFELLYHQLIKYEEMRSDTLSIWWGKEMKLKASILLPASYHPENKQDYPIRYNIAGYGGRYDRVNRLAQDSSFMHWWQSEEAPQVINVFLDSDGPFGGHYQLDSDNNGPYGHALVHEFIPYLEQKYRQKADPKNRFLDGCSTGGWVSLALQIFYPDKFDGAFSYSPDAVDFSYLQLVDIYNDSNSFTNEFGYKTPVARSLNGKPTISVENFIRYENALGRNNSFVTSGGQFGAHHALYGPKGENSLPIPLFDPHSGHINKDVSEHWKKYDLVMHLRNNWESLGSKLQDKIYVWMGDMDHFYLNFATRSLDRFFRSTTLPPSDAVIEFTPMSGHCTEFSHKKVLSQIADTITRRNAKK
jgi:S-formylglutathione hydrolase FrmB